MWLLRIVWVLDGLGKDAVSVAKIWESVGI